MEQFNDQLDTLLDKRRSTLAGIIAEESSLLCSNRSLEERKLQIKLDLEKEISEADQATVKTKYSNETKRRLELEKRLSIDEEMIRHTTYKQRFETQLACHEAQDKINKLEERFLFKQIDIYLAEKDIKEKEKEGTPIDLGPDAKIALCPNMTPALDAVWQPAPESEDKDER